ALLEIVEARKYARGLTDAREKCERGQWVRVTISVTLEQFSTIEANLDSIGLLPADLPLLVPRFLVLSKSVIEDFKVLANVTEADSAAPHLAARYAETIAVMTEAIRIGKQVVATVATMYGSPHRRIPLLLRLRGLCRRVGRRLRLIGED
ncbi:MAG TPA: hypothetical protein VMB48_12185, partial [Steroidobacteraceae bacterium]|nr:hypothetical protein [Steroidobacteraceae bacterium]